MIQQKSAVERNIESRTDCRACTKRELFEKQYRPLGNKLRSGDFEANRHHPLSHAIEHFVGVLRPGDFLRAFTRNRHAVARAGVGLHVQLRPATLVGDISQPLSIRRYFGKSFVSRCCDERTNVIRLIDRDRIDIRCSTCSRKPAREYQFLSISGPRAWNVERTWRELRHLARPQGSTQIDPQRSCPVRSTTGRSMIRDNAAATSLRRT